jgi:YidC/Oxa1 family membrane protein insertase
VAEVRRREELKGLPAKHLFDYGHPRLEEVAEQGRDWRAPVSAAGRTTVLIAPTWGDDSIFNLCGQELMEVLLQAGFHVIMRPHYQSTRLTPEVIASLRDRFLDQEHFEYIDRMDETDSILRSDILISDWSAMAMEYAMGLEKPVLFIDVPRRIRNPDWRELGIEPLEAAIREQAGEVLDLSALDQAPAFIERLLAAPDRFRNQLRELREKSVFRFGHSIPDGAAEIARLANELFLARRERELEEQAHD